VLIIIIRKCSLLTTHAHTYNAMLYTIQSTVAGLMDPADIRTGEEDEEQLLGGMRVKLFKLELKPAAAAADDDTKEATTTAQPEYVEVGIGLMKVLQTAKRKTDTAAAAAAAQSTAAPPTDSKATREKADSSSAEKAKPADAAGTNGADTAADSVAAAPAAAAARIVMRRESHPGGPGTKVILNVALRGKVSMVKLAEKALRLTAMTDKNVLSTYLLKTKSADEADKLLACVTKQLCGAVK
jgi:hypothetical protein